MPCAISFRNAKISETGIFATITGKCSECECEFLGRIANKPQPDASIFMECTIQGFNPVVKHVKNGSSKAKHGPLLPNSWLKATDYLANGAV